jgi:hypothetical protein
MSDTPKFTVVDRRKFREDDETSVEAASPAPAIEEAAVPAAPRLTLVESPHKEPEAVRQPEPVHAPVAVADELDGELSVEEDSEATELPPAPTDEEARFQKMAYEKAAERLEDLVRAQNPAAPASEKIGFEHLVQQLYLSAMMQMGAGTPEGQRPRIDILGGRQTIDLLNVVDDKTRGNLSKDEERTLQTVLFELRMTFLELTRMISAPKPNVPPPGPVKR